MKDEILKITNAVYSVLDYFPEDEPLKNKAKEKALAILENLTKEKASAELLDDIEVLKNYLSLAKYQGLVSDMNFLILTKEYEQIKNQINIAKPVEKEVLPKEEKTNVRRRTTTNVGRWGKNKSFLRQKQILDIVSGRDKTQVTDIVKQLPNVTKRTIRRDLDDLLKEGKIARIGEWNQVSYQIS